jgi:hypothetical protein
MNAAAMFAFASAIFCGVMAVAVIRNEHRSVVHWVFVAGMALLALDSVFNGLAWQAGTQSWESLVYWHRYKLYADALLPGTWVFFALGYGRGNYRDFLNRWKFLLLAMFVVPAGLVLFDDNDLLATDQANHLVIGGMGGLLFFVVMLAGFLLAGINLEKTFRASVGVMRWRIKFMILGLGVLFAVRFCTSSQILLTHTIDPRLEMVDVGALCAGCLLMLRSLFREGHFDLDVYPSHAVLQGSLTVMLAGVYLLAIGVLAKLLALFPLGQNTVVIQWSVLVGAAVVLTILLLSDRVRLRINRFVSRHFQRPLYD